MWMAFRDGIADPALRAEFKPKLLCEAFLLHQHPGPISVAEVDAVQKHFRTQNNRRYANLSTEQKTRKLQERDALLAENARQRAEIGQLRSTAANATARAILHEHQAALYARAADVTAFQLLRGASLGGQALAAVRSLPHCEAASGLLQPFHPVGDPGIVLGEDIGAVLDASGEQLTLDLEWGSAGV